MTKKYQGYVGGRCGTFEGVGRVPFGSCVAQHNRALNAKAEAAGRDAAPETAAPEGTVQQAAVWCRDCRGGCLELFVAVETVPSPCAYFVPRSDQQHDRLMVERRPERKS